MLGILATHNYDIFNKAAAYSLCALKLCVTFLLHFELWWQQIINFIIAYRKTGIHHNPLWLLSVIKRQEYPKTSELSVHIQEGRKLAADQCELRKMRIVSNMWFEIIINQQLSQ